jgi:hypothetical protein
MECFFLLKVYAFNAALRVHDKTEQHFNFDTFFVYALGEWLLKSRL